MLREITAVTRDIIIIIVAATFIELLLPRSGFRRYIRMVVGLLIILALISAVQQFVGLSPGSAADLFFRQMDQQGAALEGLSAEDGDLFHQRVQMEYRARVEAEAERVAREFLGGRGLPRAQVILREDGEFSGEVDTIRIYLSDWLEESLGVGIDPVVIEIRPEGASSGEGPTPVQENQPLREHLARHFQLQEGQVEIICND